MTVLANLSKGLILGSIVDEKVLKPVSDGILRSVIILYNETIGCR